jgi:surfeit locus 1 family protein
VTSGRSEIFRTQRRPGLLIPSVLASGALAVLLALGIWQVQRKAWKEALIATVTERFAAPAVRLPSPAEWPRLDPANDEFRRVTFAAEFLNDKESLVYTTGSSLRADGSGPGYWVFTPARLAGVTVMVNRGFVPEGRQDPATRQQGEVAGPVDIVGVMRWPERPGLFTPAADPAGKMWFARDSSAMAAVRGLGPAVAPFYVEQEAPPARGGLPRVGTLQPTLPNNHLGYALTWFGLALVLVGSFVVWSVGHWRGR